MQRILTPERMDDPALPRDDHERALRGLRRINSASRISDHLARMITRISAPQPARSESSSARAAEPLSIVDLACGSGDTAILLARHAQRHGLKWRITGIDRSPTAIDLARSAASSSSLAVSFEVGDVLEDDWPDTVDVAVCSLFLHHLRRADAVKLTRRMFNASTTGIIINDLVRSRIGWAFAWAGTRVISRSPIVHFDGPQSVRAAWTPSELREIAFEAGIPRTHVHVRHTWPFRMTLTATASELL